VSEQPVAVVTFPGSNCDRDAVAALDGLGVPAHLVRHTVTDLDAYRAVVLPGGFSYGDYLRAGALAARAPVMQAVRRLAAAGRSVLGICNGFQILCEAGLLPGALHVNVSRRFVCDWVDLRVAAVPPGWRLRPGERWRMPVAHGEGAYRAAPGTLEELWRNGQVLLQYVDPDGTPDPRYCPNGSDANIAAITNRAGNVVGMMPHPERAAEVWLGGTDGRRFLSAWLERAQSRAAI
jgi:phosphoribosylformylglycinamidine synthase I